MKKGLIALGSIVGVLAYVLPMLLRADLLNDVYSIGTSLAFGVVLIGCSYKSKTIFDKMITSAGVFFIGLSIVFIHDIFNLFELESYVYVLFDSIITIICFLMLLLRHFHTRR